MPLPDERPRQSVANLIGRFETQTKRLSLSAGTPSRSNSVISHITSDSAREEIKEKREWPPKSIGDKEKEKPPPTAYRPIPPAVNTQSSPPKDVPVDEVPLTAKALNASQMQANAEPHAFLENWRKDLPEPTEMVPEPATAAVSAEKPADVLATPTPASASKFTSSQPPARTSGPKTPAVKTPLVRTALSTPARVPAKPAATKPPPSKPSITPSASQPLKPQHTGQSTASTAASARRTAAKTPTAAPPRTPARSEASVRARTPTSARPKTPSSGLFAPTAASLARARNAAPPVPQPARKATISSTSMERLSKPTTASLNKAKSAASAATSSKAPAKMPATPPRAGGVAKPKSAMSPSPSRVKAAKKEGVIAKAAGAAAVVGVAAGATAAVAEESAHEEDTNSHTEDVLTSEPEDHASEIASEPAILAEEVVDTPHEVPHEVPEPTPEPSPAPEEPPVEPEVVDNDTTPRSPSPQSPVQPLVVEQDHTEEPEHAEEEAVEEEHEEEEIEVPESAIHPKDELEAIVNLLETAPILKPTPDTDDLREIPDVDDAT